MTAGLILLVFIGLLLAYFVSRGRRRLGVPTPGKVWLVIIVAVILLGLFLWASSAQH